jgi:hypothetical protein
VESAVVRLPFVVRTALGLVALACAVLLVLTGFDAFRWRGQLERGDVALAAHSSDPGVWEPETILPTGVSRFVLGAGEGVAYARAVQQYELARRSRGPGFLQNPILPKAQFTLLRFGQGNHRDVDRSHALTMYGVLLYGGLAAQDLSVVVILDRTIDQFRKAIQLDPDNGAAKYDLEYLLRRVAQQGGGQSEGPPPKKSSRGQRTGAGSPGSALPGGGF